MCVTLPTCVVSTAVCCLSFIGMTISKNTLHNWLKKGKKYLDELVCVLKSIMSDGYKAYVFIGDELKSARFKDTIHQVCMSHAKNRFVKAYNQGGEPAAERFSNILKEFFMRERKCNDAGFTPEERLRERQSLETKGLLIELRSLLESELSKDSEFRSQYYTEALNYLNRFWKEIFAYLDDGELPIDNNLAERTIRKLTTQRNNSLHYGSDTGAENHFGYRPMLRSCFEFLQKVFLGLMYPFSCVLWAIFWSFSLLFFVR